MKKQRYYYLFYIQFLGFRFHGWQKQNDVSTIQQLLEKNLKYVLGHNEFKTLGAGRTDRMVSAKKYAFELFSQHSISENFGLVKKMNANLPGDVKVLSYQEVSDSFNVIKDVKVKEYRYYFSNERTLHPFAAPTMVNISKALDIALMQEGAKLYKGNHNFKQFCCRPKADGQFYRTIKYCAIVSNDDIKGAYFPENSYYMTVVGKGFMRYQVRIMMGVLLELGKGNISLDVIKNSLENGGEPSFNFIAPASGLLLENIIYLDS